MKNYDRDLLLLYKSGNYSDDLLQHEVECLHELLLRVENDELFCISHELVTRHKITSRKKQILRAVSHSRLKPFNFLLNKN